MLTKRVGILLAVVGLAAALPSMSAAPEPAADKNIINSTAGDGENVESIVKNCINNGACNKFKLYMMADQALDKGSFKITEGISIVKSPDTVPGDGAPRSLTPDDIQKQDIFSLMINRAERFLKTHTFKFDLKGSEVIDAVSNGARALGDATDALGLTEEEEGDGVETARRKVKKAGKMLMPLLIMMKMKAAALIPIALGAIALIAGKALLIGKIALLLSGIIALKKLLSGQHKSVTYEIVSHPHHTSSHEHHGGHESFSSGGGDLGGGGYGGGHGGWGRSSDAAQDLAYKGYQPKAQ